MFTTFAVRLCILSMASWMVCCLLPSVASAQLIGNRTVGTSPGSIAQRSPGSMMMPGSLGAGAAGNAGSFGASPPLGSGLGMQAGSSRFLRGNRSRQDFVGSNRTDLTGFVGSGQALGVGRVASSAETVRIESTRSSKVNRPLPSQPKNSLYYPRLEIDFALPSPNTSGREEIAVPSEMLDRVRRIGGNHVQVIMNGSTAVLRGSVDSTSKAELIVQLLNFEPSIENITNDLTME